MPSIQIQILTASPKQKPAKTPGKTYTVLDLAYKNLTFQSKVEGRELMSFGANKPAYDALAAANSGDVFNIEVIKNDKGYNDWVSATKSDGSAAAPAQPAADRAAINVGQTAAVKSTYETPEERAKKQIYIVRQSSISSAIDLLTTGAKTAPDVKQVLEVAGQFEDFVFGTKAQDGGFQLVDDFADLDTLDDVPL